MMLRPPEFDLKFYMALVDRSLKGHCPLVLLYSSRHYAVSNKILDPR